MQGSRGQSWELFNRWMCGTSLREIEKQAFFLWASTISGNDPPAKAKRATWVELLDRDLEGLGHACADVLTIMYGGGRFWGDTRSRFLWSSPLDTLQQRKKKVKLGYLFRTMMQMVGSCYYKYWRYPRISYLHTLCPCGTCSLPVRFWNRSNFHFKILSFSKLISVAVRNFRPWGWLFWTCDPLVCLTTQFQSIPFVRC